MYRENQPPTITGYEARNTVTVTMSDLTKVGTLIDARSQAGANDIAGIAFTLRQDRPARDRALVEATSEAMHKADMIARALGRKVANRGSSRGRISPTPTTDLPDWKHSWQSDSVATPIEVGSLDISSRVMLIAEVE